MKRIIISVGAWENRTLGNLPKFTKEVYSRSEVKSKSSEPSQYFYCKTFLFLQYN